MKRWIGLLLSCLLFSCTVNLSFAQEPQDIDYTTGTPWMNIDLEGVVTEDTPVSLKDNYALYVNKEAILETEIPEGYHYAGTLNHLVQLYNEDIKNLFANEAPTDHDALLAYKLYQLYMDWDTRNALGVEPLKERLSLLQAIDSLDELSDYFLEAPLEEQSASLWDHWYSPDKEDSSRHILTISTPPLLLEDSAEYTNITDYGRIKKEAQTELSQRILKKLGYSQEEADQTIENCLAFEAMLAPQIFTNEEVNQADYEARSYNVYSLEELKKAQGKIEILEMLSRHGFPETERYVVENPSYLNLLNDLYTEENLPLMRDYLIVHTTLNEAPYLDRECYEWSNDRANKINGSSGILADEIVFANEVGGILVWPMAKLYSDSYLKQEDKDRLSTLVDETITAYHKIIMDADYLSKETREKAIEKLEAIKINVLYPDSWEKYSYEELELLSPEEGGTLPQAFSAIDRFFMDKDAKDFIAPVDKDKWVLSPHELNCFYYSSQNAIYILGSFARGDIYNSEMSDEEVYGKMGAVIGHEISHAFDSSGAQFDKEGNMKNWWTEADYAAFLERNAKMEEYYNAMQPWEGQNFYGSIMTGEACADMAGIKAMLEIASTKENFDYDTFFRAFAELWMTKDTQGRAYQLLNNVHPMNYLRINCTLQQFDQFLDFYGITEGDKMYLAPQDRVAIW